MRFLYEEDGCPKYWLQILAAMFLMVFGTIVISILFAEILVVVLGIKTVEEVQTYTLIPPLLTILSYALVSKLLLTMFKRANRTTKEAMGLKLDSSSVRKMIFGFAVACLFVAIYLTAGVFSGRISVRQGEAGSSFLLFVIAEIATIIGEEFLFRGFILRVLMIKFPAYNAILLLMAIVGIYTFAISWSGVIPAVFLLSQTLLLVEMAYKSGSLVMPISFHVMFNLLTRFFFGLNAIENSVMFSSVSDSFLFGNASAGIEASFLMVFLFVFLSIIFVLYYKKINNESKEFIRISQKYKKEETTKRSKKK